MMDTLILSLQQDWAIRALVASSMVGISCGMLGCFIVLRNMSLVGDALSHAILPGVFFAFILVGYSAFGFFIGAVIAGLVTAFAITWIQSNVQTKSDAAVGIVFTAMFSVGVTGISWLNNQGGVHLELQGFLFGNALAVSDTDVNMTIGVTMVTIAAFLLLYRYLFITTFQPTIAATMGISVQSVYYMLMILLSLVVVSALNTVGVILVVAMLITPASTALLLSDKLKVVIVIAAISGVLSAVAGLVVAIIFDIPPGPAMVLAATALYMTTVILAPDKGLVGKAWRAVMQRRKIIREDIIRQAIKKPEGIEISDIAETLGLSLPKVKASVDVMARQGILSGNDSVVLTIKGREMGNNLVRAHRLWESYQVSTMGLTEEQIHDEADRLEHHLTRKMVDDVDAKLGYPTSDPHGSPIPQLGLVPDTPLLNLAPRSKAKIARRQISDHIESELWELGLLPNTQIAVVAMHSDHVTIRKGSAEIDIPADLARLINVAKSRN